MKVLRWVSAPRHEVFGGVRFDLRGERVQRGRGHCGFGCLTVLCPNHMRTDCGGMTFDILSGIGALVVGLRAAAQIPAAIAAVLRACRPVIDAARDLRIASTRPQRDGDEDL